MFASIRCIQVNLQHCIAATIELSNILPDIADIALVQEPYCISNKLSGFKNSYITLYSDQDQPYAALIVPQTTLPVFFHRNVSNRYVCCAEFGEENSSVILVSVYCPPSSRIDSQLTSLEFIINKFRQKRIIIAGDFNAHSQVWTEGAQDIRGEKVLDFMSSNGLQLHNVFGMATFESAVGTSCIDLTFTNSLAVQMLRDWNVIDVDSLSDHRYIGFKIQYDYCTHHIRESYAFGNANWDLFANSLSTSFKELKPENIETKTEAELYVTKVLSFIRITCDQAIPRRKIKHRSVAWWSHELTILRKENNYLRRKYQRARDPRLRETRRAEYRAKRMEYKTEIKLSKIRSWKSFCTECSRNPWEFIYKMCNNKQKTQSYFSNIKLNGAHTNNLEDTLSALMNKFFPQDNEKSETPFQTYIRQQLNEPYEVPDTPCFTITEVKEVITNLRVRKTPGHDKITAEIVKKIFSLCPIELTEFYNICLKFGIFPQSWKSAIVVVIPKATDADPSDIHSYRPISLLPILGKVLDKLMINRIDWHMEQEQILSEFQFGFRRNRCAEDAISLLTESIQNNLSNNKYTVAISLDITGAFDHAWWPMILFKLKEMKCPRNLYFLVADYFNERNAYLHSGSVFVRKEVSRGCPQGSVSGPTFWNILYNDFLKLEKGPDIVNIAFADDCILLFSANSRKEIELKGTSLLTIVNNWGKQYKLTFNPRKTKGIVFTLPQSKTDLYRRTPIIKMENQSISIVKSLKYLGVILDNKLLWKDHILMMKLKIIKLFNALAAVSRAKWGLNEQALKLIYNCVFIPVVSYACNVWGHTLNKLYIRKHLFSAQRIAALRITKAYRTTSVDALCVLAGIKPVDLLIQEKIVHFNLRKGYTVRIENETYEQGSYELKLPSSSFDNPWNRFEIKLSDNVTSYDFSIFTDGSKFDFGVGSAYVVYNRAGEEIYTFQTKLNPRCSIFQAELLALYQSIKWCTLQDKTKNFSISSDSKSAIAALTDPTAVYPLVANIKTMMHLNDLINNVHFKWVRAHTGIIGNERADELAKTVAANDNEPQYQCIPQSFLKRELSQYIISLWQNRWNSSDTGRLTHEFFPNIQERLRKKTIKINFYSCQFFTGHGKFQSYLHRFHLCISSSCQCGALEETVKHILFECPRFSDERIPLELTAIIFGLHWPCDLKLLTSTPELTEELLNFFLCVSSLM